MYLMKFDLALFGTFCGLMLVVKIVDRIVVAGWGKWLVLGLGIVAGLAAVGFFFWFRFRLRNNLAHLAGNLDALSPLVKQAQRGTFNGLDAYPHMRTFAEAIYRRQQIGLDLENALSGLKPWVSSFTWTRRRRWCLLPGSPRFSKGRR